MLNMVRRGAMLVLAVAVFATPAPTQAQAIVETCSVTARGAAGAAAIAGADGNAEEGQVAGPSSMFGAVGTNVVSALGGDTQEVSEAVREQQRIEREVIAPLAGIIAVGGC